MNTSPVTRRAPAVWDGRIHVIPLGDVIEHTTSLDCICQPDLEYDGHLVVHRAFDGRPQAHPPVTH
jgi:hypothetical protein